MDYNVILEQVEEKFTFDQIIEFINNFSYFSTTSIPNSCGVNFHNCKQITDNEKEYLLLKYGTK